MWSWRRSSIIRRMGLPSISLISIALRKAGLRLRRELILATTKFSVLLLLLSRRFEEELEVAVALRIK